jgi:PBP1b-binding outer membrane lipoprotein LpoB
MLKSKLLQIVFLILVFCSCLETKPKTEIVNDIEEDCDSKAKIDHIVTEPEHIDLSKPTDQGCTLD